ncbi:MAG TPA: hypothetical protein VF132_01015 [Rudaea sp.]
MKTAWLGLSFAAALAAGSINGHAGSVEKKTPTNEEMSPARWRQLQLQAADKSDEIMKRAEKQPGLLGQYAYMQLSYDTNRDRAFQLIFGQYLSWFQTYIGDYDAARTTFSIAQPPQPDDATSPLSGSYTVRPAAEVILEMAKDRKAVFFNEAHSAPITRTLTIELLGKLREQGFNYFAAETLYSTDKDLQKRGYPTAKTGFYTNEPLYGEMVRTALRLGYRVMWYDAENAGVGDPRERAGAENLYSQVFKKDPNARVVVNAGFAHVQKSGKYLGGTSMGEFFQKISGIDPLTIEQTMMIEHARPDQDHPFYTAIVQTRHPHEPIVFVGADGKPWTLKPGQYDMSVVFPARENNSPRPAWVALDGLRVPYPVGSELCHNQFPCLVEARYASEGVDAIAADRAVLNVIDDKSPMDTRLLSGHGSAEGRLYLRPDRYILTATDRYNRPLSSREIVIGNATVQK